MSPTNLHQKGNTHSNQSVFTKIKSKVSATWEKLKNFCAMIKSLLADNYKQIVCYFTPRAEPTEHIEEKWIKAADDAILLSIEGTDPFDTYRRMSPDERMLALIRIGYNYAEALNAPHCDICFSDELSPNTEGDYLDSENCIRINTVLTDNPASEEKAIIAISTIIHEVFHLYQIAVITNPEDHKDVPADIVYYWSINKKNYCTYEQNPKLHVEQPIERYAIFVNENVLNHIKEKNS